MATSAEIENKVTEIISENLGIEREKVTLSSKLIQDLGADSLDLVELVMAFEEAFGCDIADEDAEKITTVSDAVDYIKKHSN